MRRLGLRLLPLVVLAWPLDTLAKAPCTVIVESTVYLPDGPRDKTTVVIEGDRIRSVGAADQTTRHCRQVDGRGKILTAGLIETQSNLGLVEVSLEQTSVDTSLTGKGDPLPVRAAFRVYEGYNPNSTLVPIARRHGITSALILPRGGLVSGQAAWVDLRGRSQADAVRSESVAMVAHLGQREASRASAFHHLRRLFREARAFLKVQDDWAKNKTRPFARVADLRALKPVLTREIPLVLTAHRASDIERAVAFGEEFQIRIVISGGAEAWTVAKTLASKKIPVIVDPESNGPGSFDQIHGRADNAARLAKAGVPLILSTFSTHNVRKLAQMAGNAVREGLDHSAAIKAITETPALVFGLKGVGQIKAGSLANLVLWSGDPLELEHVPVGVWIQGVSQSLESRQTRLRDRYLKLPGAPQPGVD